MAKPNIWNVGDTVEVFDKTYDLDGIYFVPIESRISMAWPDGTVTTVSGGAMITASGEMYYPFKINAVGWHEYEVAVKDASGREKVLSGGFEAVDQVI